MRRTIAALILGAGISAIGVSAASAMPVSKDLAGAAATPEQVRLVCDQWGRCWRTGPRYRYRYGYGPRYRYGHYGPRYGYYGGPGYYHRRYYGGPGFGFGFRF